MASGFCSGSLSAADAVPATGGEGSSAPGTDVVPAWQRALVSERFFGSCRGFGGWGRGCEFELCGCGVGGTGTSASLSSTGDPSASSSAILPRLQPAAELRAGGSPPPGKRLLIKGSTRQECSAAWNRSRRVWGVRAQARCSCWALPSPSLLPPLPSEASSPALRTGYERLTPSGTG